MNDKLKQSLDTRLGGMRWGERDQAEVFRLAQRKELQDVKHVKQGAGMLAIAIALLFIVMGAAFALTTANDQPESNNIAGQTALPTFAPIASHLYENDYFTLDVNTSTCTDTEAAFTATLRMKAPESHMLNLCGHTPPGDVDRALIPVSLFAGISTTLPGDIPMACGQFSDVDVTDMTADTAIFHMSGSIGSLYEDVIFTLFITWTDPADGVEHRDAVTWRIDAPTQQGMLLQKFDLVTVTLAEYTADATPDGATGHLVLNVTPSKPWYVLNREEEGKSTLTVSAGPMLLYPASDPQDMLRMVEYREPTAGELPVTLEVTSDGLRLTAEGMLPVGEEALYGYLVLHVYSAAAEAHYDEGFDDHYYEICQPIVTMPTGAASVTATPAPVPYTRIPATPTPSPMPIVPDLTPTPLPVQPTPAPPVRSEPTGDHIGGTDTVSVFLEESWYDGFTAEMTLRVRADDASDILAITPNLGERPNEDTWVVQMEGNGNEYYQTYITSTLALEENTGDVLVRLAYQDPIPTGDSSFTLPVVLRVVNEKTWQTETDDISIRLEVNGEQAWHPLYLVSSETPDTFIQAGYIITDRYTYVGVMQTYDNHYPAFILADAEGNVLASRTSSPAVNPAIEQTLFPAPYTGSATNVTASVVQLPVTQPLPEMLVASFHAQDGDYLRHFELSAVEPQTAPQLSESLGTLLGVNDIVSVYLADSWFDGFSATATLRICTKDPLTRLAIEPNLDTAPSEETYVAQLTGSYENHYVQGIVPKLTLDEATGDVIVQVTFVDCHTTRDKLHLPVTLTLTNEKTWQSIATELDININASGSYPRRTLYLTGGEHTDAFLQSRYIITDRYTYIGVMRTYDGYTGIVQLTDAEGNVLASTEMTGSYSSFSSIFFDQPATANRVGLSYLRINGTQSLPEELHVRYPTEATDPVYEQYPSLKPGEQPLFILSPTKPSKTR